MKINDLYPIEDVIVPVTTLIFNTLVTFTDLNDFINENNVNMLNQEYYMEHSGDKYVSPFVEKLYDNGKTPAQISSLVAQICHSRFGVKWKKIYDALMTQYNPLENYSMEETKTPNLTDTDTETTKSNISTDRTTSATNKYKGFNATEPVVVSKTDGSENVTTSGASTNNEISSTITHTGTETLERAGNIGVTTSQQMLESEFKVRQYDFYKEMYNDIDTILCLAIY